MTLVAPNHLKYRGMVEVRHLLNIGQVVLWKRRVSFRVKDSGPR